MKDQWEKKAKIDEERRLFEQAKLEEQEGKNKQQVTRFTEKDKESALHLEEQFNVFTQQTNLRIFCVYEEGNINHQKETIYFGMDIVIGTPKRLNKIYFQNGINLADLQLFIIEDAEFLEGQSHHTEIHRIYESLNKCQTVVFSNEYGSKIEKLQELFLARAGVIIIQ